MDEETVKNDGLAIVVILVGFILLAFFGYVVGLRDEEPVSSGEVITSTIPMVTSTVPVEP